MKELFVILFFTMSGSKVFDCRNSCDLPCQYQTVMVSEWNQEVFNQYDDFACTGMELEKGFVASCGNKQCYGVTYNNKLAFWCNDGCQIGFFEREK